MAFFKFRKRGDDASVTSSQASPAESVEAMRKRARQRLIGAAVLVLVGVIGFPLVFDTQPRPIAVDIPIEIPDRAKAKPLAAATAAPVAAGAVATVGTEPAPAVPAAAPATAAPAASAVPPVAALVQPKPEPKPEPKAEPKPEPKAEPKVADADRAKALLEGKAPAAVNGEGRFVVQVGAFADATKAGDVRQKLEKAGLKTYTHVAETKEGKRIRVRLGPFATKAEADKAAAKAIGLNLQASVLTL